MKIHRLVTIILCSACFHVALAQDIDTELSKLTEALAGKIKDQNKKKVAVLDFTDLEGRSNGELGRYIAEQLTVDLVMEKRDFSVLDRANLNKILAEHKLTATGLVDPDNAKKLGMFAGVDALILGTIIPKGNNINLTVKIITTDTAEIVGAARAQFTSDVTVQQLTSKPLVKTGGETGVSDEAKPAIVKTLDDLRVDLESLRIVNKHEYLLTMTLTNLNARKSIWAAVRMHNSTMLTGNLTDADGFQYTGSAGDVTGIAANSLQHDGFFHPTEIKPGESFPCTVKLRSYTGRPPTGGQCILQMDFLLGYNFSGNFGSAVSKSLQAKMETTK